MEPISWLDVLREAPGDLRLRHELGLEWAPDDPLGRFILTLAPDGTVELEHAQRGETRSWRGSVNPSTATVVMKMIAAAGFPDEVHDWIPTPGPSFRRITLDRGTETVTRTLQRTEVEYMPGFEQAFVILDQIAAELSGIAALFPVNTGTRHLLGAERTS